MVHNLTERQEEVLIRLQETFKQEGRFPTYQELMDELHYKSTNSIHQIMKALVKKGYLVKDDTHYAFAPERYVITPQQRDEAIALYIEVLDGLIRRQVEAGVDRSTVKQFRRDQIDRFLDTIE